MLAPEVAPLADAGVRDVNLEVWTALVGPSRLSSAARLRLAEVVPDIIRREEVRQRLFNVGWEAVGSSSEAARRRVAQEGATMRRLIQATGIRAGT